MYHYFSQPGSIVNSRGDYPANLSRLGDAVVSTASELGLDEPDELADYLGRHIYFRSLSYIAKGMSIPMAPAEVRQLQTRLQSTHVARNAGRREPRFALLVFLASHCLPTLIWSQRLRALLSPTLQTVTTFFDEASSRFPGGVR